MVDLELAVRVITEGKVDNVDDVIDLVLVPADDLYENVGSSPLSDDQYDQVKQLVRGASPNHRYLGVVGSEVRGGKVKLPFQMGSLTQAHQGELAKWISDHGLKPNDVLVISAKLDGTSGVTLHNRNMSLQIAYSRGNGYEGADITRHIKHVLPAKLEGKASGSSGPATRGENIISKTNFTNHVQPNFTRSDGSRYRAARNAVGGILNGSANDINIYKYVDFVAYQQLDATGDKLEQFEKLKRMGFKVPWFTDMLVKDITEEKLATIIDDLRKTYDYTIDGVVVEVNSAALRDILEDGKLNPNWAFKYKTTSDENYVLSEVIEVEWNPSPARYGKPRVLVKAVQLGDITWSYATGYNAKWIVDNNIGPGAIVAGSRCGDVTPNIIEIIKPASAPQMPADGTYEWNETGVDIIMTDAASDRTVAFRTLTEVFKSLNVDFLRDGTSEKIIDVTGTNFSDTFVAINAWSQQQWVAALGANGRKIHKSFHERMALISLSDWLGSMPFFGRGVGRRKMAKLLDGLNIDNMDGFNGISEQQIASVRGFEQTTAAKITSGMEIHAEFFESLTNPPPFTAVACSGNAMADQKVVLTGFRDKAIEEWIADNGGSVQSAVSSSTTIVVAADLSQVKGKIAKANALVAKGQTIEMMELGGFRAKYMTTPVKADGDNTNILEF